jgi:membrane protease YdiL (CAAX protease family)
VDPKTIESLKEGILAAGIVAAVTVAFALPLWGCLRLFGKPFRTPWPFPGIPRQVAGIVIAMFPVGLIGFQIGVATVSSVLPARDDVGPINPEAAKQLRILLPTLLVTPCLVAAYAMLRDMLNLPPARHFLRNLLLGCLGWFVLMPATFAVHFLALQTMLALGIPETQHPLTALKPQDDGCHGVLFTLSVCLCTPMVEEILFRGLLVPWAAQKKIYPWVLMFAAFLMAALTGEAKFGPGLFVIVLTVVLFVVMMWGPQPRVPRRTVSAVLASSALFAAAHSAVWPTPIPLFVLACGLGYLTARTRSVVPGIVVHGLFNAVSVVMLYRG